MKLNVLRELRQPIGSISAYDFEESMVQPDGLELRDVRGLATLLRTDRGLLVSVAASATTHERCSRCLTEIRSPVEIHFEEEYLPVMDANTGASVRISDTEETFRINVDFTLDLREALRQYTLMFEPTKPLCRADCAGLCLECGADLNVGPCGCSPMVEPRWQALAGLVAGDREGS